MASDAWLGARLAVKRAADATVAAALLVTLLPALLLIALAVKATSPGEVIFRQKRAGRGGRLFTILKFRTMVKDAPSSSMGSYCYRDDPRITRVGRFLRKASLDELPQLVNILRGDMSLVGPRPDLPQHVARYTAFQRQRLAVRPGVTGWAQVNGRNAISWDDRIQLDIEYIRGWSLGRDVAILLRTVAVVLSGKGVELPEKARRIDMGPGQGSDPLTVLVTGAGAPPGVAIMKALRQSTLRPRIVATDAEPLSVGLFRADSAYVLPRVADEGAYREALEDVCRRERVALVCFGTEVEMRRLARHVPAIEQRTGARLVLNEPGAVDAFMDKWTTTCVLREHDLPVPDTVLADDAKAVDAFFSRHSFPMVLKPRHGSGSKNLFVVRGEGELASLARWVPDAVLQEYLAPDDQEYTVGVYKGRVQGFVGQIVFRRSLAAGLTYKAEVVHDAEIEAVCRKLVASFDVWGPVNVQLRKTAAGVRIFEINLRFSSSVPMRAHFGFNEPELCLRDVVLGESIAPLAIRPGVALRYWDEVYLEPSEVAVRHEEARWGERRGTKPDDF